MDVPETRYARSGGYHIAYQTAGAGPPDVVSLWQMLSNVEACWESPPAKSLFRMASFGRLILFDKRGSGLSDPIPLQTQPTLEEWMDDLVAVLDTVGSQRAAIVAAGLAGPMAMLFASTYPERTSALVLAESYARITRAPDYPFGMPEELLEGVTEFVLQNWGRGVTLSRISPEHGEKLRAAVGRYERQVASPGAAASSQRVLLEADVRHVLSSIQAPTLVIHHVDNTFIRADHSRYLAEHIHGARYLELPGADQYPWNEQDRDRTLDEIEEFLTGVAPTPHSDRVLATVLFTDVVDSTKHAVAHGDRAWRQLLERHRELVRRQLARHRGKEIGTTGDGFLATFDGPARAIHCAAAIIQASRALGIEVRAGLHTGEIELMGSDVGGVAVHIGARVSALAGPSEILTSGTVKDLVAGSGIEFDDRGNHQLKGVPGEWRLYAVRS